MPDPFGITPTCPYCRSQLADESTVDETHFYQCGKCGRLQLPPDGRIRWAPCGKCDKGWVCESHPDQPVDHILPTGDKCGGAGAPCDCPRGRALVAYLDAKYRSDRGVQKPH